jgi:hypothetical protein
MIVGLPQMLPKTDADQADGTLDTARPQDSNVLGT